MLGGWWRVLTFKGFILVMVLLCFSKGTYHIVRAMIWTSVPQSPSVKGSVVAQVLLGGSGTFRWNLVGGLCPWAVASKGTAGLQLHPLTPPLLSAPLPRAPEQQGQ